MWGGAWDLEGGFPAGVVGVHFGYSLLDGASDRDGGVVLVSDVDGHVEGDSGHDVRDLEGLGSTEEDQNASSDAENGDLHLRDRCLRSR